MEKTPLRFAKSEKSANTYTSRHGRFTVLLNAENIDEKKSYLATIELTQSGNSYKVVKLESPTYKHKSNDLIAATGAKILDIVEASNYGIFYARVETVHKSGAVIGNKVMDADKLHTVLLPKKEYFYLVNKLGEIEIYSSRKIWNDERILTGYVEVSLAKTWHRPRIVGGPAPVNAL